MTSCYIVRRIFITYQLIKLSPSRSGALTHKQTKHVLRAPTKKEAPLQHACLGLLLTINGK